MFSALKKEIDSRLIKFRGGKTYNLVGKAVVLVDYGVAIGATMFAAIKWLKTQKLKALIVAIPVAPRSTIKKLREFVDEVIVLHSPLAFGTLGSFYQDFSEATDDQVIEIMHKYSPVYLH